jgi:hypothetical protein
LIQQIDEDARHPRVQQTSAADDEKAGETSVTVDGVERHDKAIPLIDDRQEHPVTVKMPTTRLYTEPLQHASAPG